MSGGMGSADHNNGNWTVLRELIARAGSRRLTLLAALMLVASLTEGIGLLLLVPLTLLIMGEDYGGDEGFSYLVGQPPELVLAGFVGLIGLRALIVYVVNEERRELGLDLTRQLRQAAHQAILRAEWRWLSGLHSGDHAALMMGEADRAGVLADRGLTILTYILTLLVLLATAALISPALVLAIIALGLLAVLPIWLMQRKRGAEEEQYTRAYVDLQRLVSGGLDHLRAARIGRGTSQFSQDFGDRSARLEQLELSYFRVGHRIHATYQVLGAALLALFIYLALFLWSLPLVLVVPALALVARAVPMIGGLQQAIRSWNHTRPALGNLVRLIEDARAHAEPSSATHLPVTFKRSIELREITLSFEGRERAVLDRFSLSIPAGSIVAISGPSGAGKSSLADILSGLIAPDHGRMTVDGRVLDGAGRLSWRKQVAYVEQRPFFIDGSISDNLMWGVVSIDDERLRSVVEMANAGFIFELPQGLATRMGERARQFSGGERQRLGLVRALLQEPDLLILDEVTAGLDRANADAIRTSIAALRGQMTVVVLGHDPAMMALADKCVELGGD